MIHKRAFWSLITLFLSLITVQSLSKTSAMRMCDSSDCELQLLLENSVNYHFYIPISHLISNNYFVICFRNREPTDEDSGSCSLGGVFNSYKCIDVSPTIASSTISSVSMTQW